MVSFSIIIPTYNRPHLINRSIDSALRNINKSDEILVIDDGSDLSYEREITKYQSDDRVCYVKTGNRGVSAARNVGLERAKNDFIAFLDDDDEWYNGHLDLHRAIYSFDQTIAAVFCNFDNTRKTGELLPDGIARWSSGKPQIKDLLSKVAVPNVTGDVSVYVGDQYKNQLTTDYILPSSLSFNRIQCGKDDKFFEGLKRNETWLFNSHLCRYGNVAYIDKITCVQHGDAEDRGTAITHYATLLSRLFVMQEEWGKNKDFLTKYGDLYEATMSFDFFEAFKISIKDLSLKKLSELAGMVGVKRFIKYAFLSLYYLFNPGKVVRRIT